jgi:alkylation response protein AidB-like acyl-CoA dehydrogenase
MNFDLSGEQEQIRDSVRKFGAAADRRALRSLPGGYSRERWREMAELGLLALAVPEASGGMGGSPIDLAIVAEALGNAIAPDPWLENGVLPARLLSAAGRDDLVESAISGDTFFAFAFAERARRFSLEPRAVVIEAVAGGDELRGEKTFVGSGALAERLLVLADRQGQATIVALSAADPGIVHHPYRLADGSIASELRFNRVPLAADADLGIGAEALSDVVALVRLLAAAEMLGLAQRLFDDTIAYAKQREQFGVPIGSFQAIQHRLVECYAALEQSRSMVYRVALGAATGGDAWWRAAAGAKAYVGDQADRIAREAVQVHGGMGVTDELAIGHALKRVLLLARLFGDQDAILAEYAEAA